jgi:SAM-dependent methyltransferase
MAAPVFMNIETTEKLLALTRQFYQTFALQFSATRARVQPGVQRVLAALPPPAQVLDLGCGNGGAARFLAQRGHTGGYIGLDASEGLLQEAQKQPWDDFAAAFIPSDLAAPGWEASPGLRSRHFDAVFIFAVLHHLPGEALRLDVLRKARALLSPGGRLTLSVWQFLHSPRWLARIQPWELIGLTGKDVDSGDYLLDWRQGGRGLRYVHHFSAGELAALARDGGFRLVDRFTSDGEGGRLGLYQTWAAD